MDGDKYNKEKFKAPYFRYSKLLYSLLLIALIATILIYAIDRSILLAWWKNVTNIDEDANTQRVENFNSSILGLQKIAFGATTAMVYMNSTTYLKERESTLLLELAEEEWWEIEQTSDHIFNQFRTSSIYLRSADLDENGIHSCYEYKVVDNQLLDKTTHYGTFCYPAIIVTGARKCSTSAMFNLLTKYPRAISSGFKENCIFFPMGDRSIIQYFDSMPRNVEVGEVIVDGCVDLDGNMKIRKMLRNPNTFYIVLVRNFADWIWSAYNFWCQAPYDKECSPIDHWVNPDIHIRSPELFHEIVEGSINGTFVANPLLIKKPCMKAASMFRTYIGTLWSNVPVENTLVLASEDLDSNPGLVWKRISQSVGLSSVHPSLPDFDQVRYNTQADLYSRGESKTVLKKDYKPGLYAVSKFQPLSQLTRSILDRCWKDDCIFSSLVTGHQYQCGEQNSEQGQVSIQDLRAMKEFSGEDGAKKIKNIRRYLSRHGLDGTRRTNGTGGNTDTFIDLKSRECKRIFENGERKEGQTAPLSLSLSLSLPLSLSTALDEKEDGLDQAAASESEKKQNSELLDALLLQLEHSNEALRLFMMENKRLKALLAASTGNSNNKRERGEEGGSGRRRLPQGEADYVHLPNGVLLLSLSPDDRIYVLNLVYFASKFNMFVDTQIRTFENISSNGFAGSLNIGNREATLKSACNPNERNRPLVVATSPQNIAEIPSKSSSAGLASSNKNIRLFYLIDDSIFQCENNNDAGKIRFVFSKVLVVLRDSVTSIWTQYQQANGFPDGIYGDAITMFDWSKWESSAILMLKNLSRPDLEGSSSLWNSRQSELVDNVAPEYKHIIRLEDLMFSQAKLRILYNLIDFIKRVEGPPVDPTSFVMSRESLKCSHLLANFRNSKKRAYLTGRANIDLAYASEGLICRIKQFYSKSPLQQSALVLPKNSSCQGAVSVNSDQSRKCKLRYERRVYLSVVKQHPVVLLSVPGSMSVTVRLLVEHSTSVLSGSMETNRYIAELFPGEQFCGQRQSIIAAHPKDVTIKTLRSKKGVISLTNQGMKKCRKGMVRGFARGVLLTRDPFMSVWLEAHKALDSSAELQRSGHDFESLEIEDKDSLLASLLFNATLAYSKTDLLAYDAFDKLNDVMTESNAIIISYEALINPNNALEKTPFSRIAALKTLLGFANYPDVYEEKLRCSYYFTETGLQMKQLEAMNKYFLAHNYLICRMNAVFRKTLQPNKFNFTRLYNEILC